MESGGGRKFPGIHGNGECTVGRAGVAAGLVAHVAAALAVLCAVPVAAAAPCDAPDPTPMYRTDPGFAKARTAALAGRTDEALALLEAWREMPGAPPGSLVDWVAGRWLEDADRPAEALRRFVAVVGSPLDDDARLREGRLQLEVGDLARARSAFAGISSASRHWAGARLALAEALVREGRAGAARVVLADLLRDDLPAEQRSGATLAMVRALTALGETEAARTLAHAAWLLAATGADLARELASLGRSPTTLDDYLRTLLKADPRDAARIARWARTHRKAADALDPGLADLARGAVLQGDPGNHDATVQTLETARRLAANATLGAMAAYQLGNVLVNGGDDRAARVQFLAAYERDPGGPLAADAVFSVARCASRTGDPAGAVAVLDRVVAADPPVAPDVRVRWEAALAWMLAGRTDEALAALDRIVTRLDRGPGLPYGQAERARYFRGVLLLSAGHRDEALADLRRVARNDPHTWYGVLARERLSQARDVRPPPFRDPSCQASRGPVWLWRLGYREEARAEMSARASAGLLDEASARILAVLLADPSLGEARARVRDFLRGPRGEGDEALVDAAYPQPFGDEVATATAETELDPALVYGVMRVESGFHPKARSPKGAVGLMQLMPASAKRVALAVLGDRKAAGGLWRPANNVRLGTAYLATLSEHFRGHLPLVLAGYHAGPGAARRFLRTLGHLPTDLFVEAIPYPATSQYVKRVVAYAAGYRALLDDGRRGPLVLQPSPPTSLGPFMEPHRPEPRVLQPGSNGLASIP